MKLVRTLLAVCVVVTTLLTTAEAQIQTFTSAQMLTGDPLTPEQILATFGSSCPSQGEWSRAAAAQTSALIDTLRNLQSDPNCQTLAGSVGSLIDLQAQLQTLSNKNAQTTDYEISKSQEQLLYLQLNDPANALDADLIRRQLIAVQLNLAGIDGETRAEQSRRFFQRQSAVQFATTAVDALLNQSLASQSCLNQKPGLLSGILSLGSSVGAAAAFSNPAVGLGLTAATKIFGSLIDYSRKAKIGRTIRELNKDLTFKAYSCVLEAFSNQFCSANDALRVLKLRDEARRNPKPTGGLLEAVRLFDAEVPVFLSWLDKIRLGGDPKTNAEAGRRYNVFYRQLLAMTTRDNGLARISEILPIFNAAQTDADRLAIIVRSVDRFADALQPSNTFGPQQPANPFLDIYDSTYSRYYLLGFAKDNLPRQPNGTLIPIEQLSVADVRAHLNPFTLETVRQYITDWSDRTKALVSQELSLVIQPDAIAILSEAVNPARDGVRIRPLDALDRIVAFLQSNRPTRFEYKGLQNLYDDQIERMLAIRAETAKAITLGNGTYAAEAVAKIYDLSKLDFTTSVFNNRFELVIRIALLQLFTTAPKEEQELAAGFLASNRLLDSLTALNPQKSIVAFLEDIKQSQSITLGALDSFGEVFGDSIRDSLQFYQQREKSVGGASAQFYHEDRTRLCLKLLAATQWPAVIPQALCSGLQLSPAQAGGPPSLLIDQTAFALPHETRACSYRTYLRASVIFEKAQLEATTKISTTR